MKRAAEDLLLMLVCLIAGLAFGVRIGQRGADRWWEQHCPAVNAVNDCKPPSCSPVADDPLVVTEANPQPPFDVPPKEWDTKFETGVEPIECNPPMPKGSYLSCGKPIFNYVHHRSCMDKSRFLLQNESGKWHCLALAQPNGQGQR